MYSLFNKFGVSFWFYYIKPYLATAVNLSTMDKLFPLNKTFLSLSISLVFTSSVMANDTVNNASSTEEEAKALTEHSTAAEQSEDQSLTATATAVMSDLNNEATKMADDTRSDVQQQLGSWAHTMDGWFGKPDPLEPASASLRIVLDTRWADDPVEGSNWDIEPRIRGKLRLPVLERRLSLIIGDEDLDDVSTLKQDTNKNTYSSSDDDGDNNKTYDRKKTRDDNASIALRWSKIEDALGIDADIGITSVDDLFFKLSVDRDLYKNNKWEVTSDNYYRYSIDSEHTVKGEVNTQYMRQPGLFINNNTNIRYRNEGDDDETTWGNELRQVHYFGKDKELSYGLSTYGYLDHDKHSLNSYGPAISYRQPFWREWLFLQTELNYFNDEEEDKDHFPSALLRFEALF